MPKLFIINRELLLGVSLVGLFFFMFIVSSEWVNIKFIFFIFTWMALRKKNFVVELNNVVVYCALMLISITAFLNGVLSNQIDGVLDEIRTFILWPSVIFILFSFKYSKKNYDTIYRIFKIYLFLAPVLMLFLLLIFFYTGGEILYLRDGLPVLSVGLNEGTISLYMININFIIFGSFLMVSGLITGNLNKILLNNNYKYPFIFSYFILFVASGRKGWYLSMVVLVLLSVFLSNRKLNIRVLVLLMSFSLILLNLVVYAMRVDIGLAWNIFLSAFEPDYGGEERFEQFNAIIRRVLDNPFLGNGLGSVADESIRNINKPWHYELTYMKLLINVGFIGLITFFLGYIFLLYRFYRFIPQLRYVCISIVAYLVINATNPYLLNFDVMWILFLPILFHNLYHTNIIK